MKKGFTLIELLAVIVILAIIALIAVPTITGLIEKAKIGSVEQSAKGYVDAVDKQKALNLMDSDDTNDINEFVYDAPLASIYNVKVKGQAPTKGWVEVTKNGVNRYSLVIGDYVVTYDGSKVEVKKGSTPADKPAGETIIYRFSNDLLYNGDKIDLKNRKYTNYTKYDEEAGKSVSTNETHDMVGIYSTNLNDVLTIRTYYDGSSIESRSNQVYLKHTVNGEGIITKSETCLVTSWGTLCQTGGESIYDETNDKWNDPNYETKKSTLLNFFKWNTENHTSGYDGFTCYFDSSYAICSGPSLGGSVYSDSNVLSSGSSMLVDCGVDRYGMSGCR